MPRRGNTAGPTSVLCHVGETPLPRHRFHAMSGKHLCPDIVFMPCRGNTSGPTSVSCHVGETPLPRHRFRAMSGKCRWPDIVPFSDNIFFKTVLQHFDLIIHCFILICRHHYTIRFIIFKDIYIRIGFFYFIKDGTRRLFHFSYISVWYIQYFHFPPPYILYYIIKKY